MSNIKNGLFSLVVTLVLTACADTDPIQPSTMPAQQSAELLHFYDYRWSLPDNPKQAISTEQVAEKLKDFDVIFFG